jgi:hypothetical protein
MFILLAIREDENRCCLTRGIVDSLEQACKQLQNLEDAGDWPEGFDAIVVDTSKGTSQFIV